MNFFYQEYFKIVAFISFSIIINVSQLVSAPLHEAILAGDMVEINKLLKAGASMYDLEPSDLSTTLHYAVRANSKVAPEMIKLCLDAGININSTDIAGSTPLHTAINFNNYQVIPMLLSNGALLTAKDATGKTPLHRAVLNKPVDIEGLQTLIQAGADLESKDQIGKTPLFYAVENGNLEAIRTLLDAGADVDIRTDNITLRRTAAQLPCKNLSDSNQRHTIEKLLNFYGNLQPGADAAKIRNTLFGQSVIEAYRKYIDQSDPLFLAKILGIDSSEQLPSLITEKAKKIFIPQGPYKRLICDENNNPLLNSKGDEQFQSIPAGEPLFIEQLISDFKKIAKNR